MSPAELVLLLVIGAASGTIAGLLGVGGGIIIVPGLAFLLAQGAAPAERLMQIAVGSSLASIVLASIASMAAHHRRGAVNWSIVFQLAPGLLFGAVLGAIIASDISSRALAIFFGLFLLVVAVRLAVNGQPQPQRVLPRQPALTAWGTGIGTVSALVGIGGGTMTVPLLTWSNVPMHQAVGTSAACGLPIALSGATAFAVTGWGTAGLPPGATGYIYWPAVAVIAPAAVLFAPLGARIAHALPVRPLKLAFALFITLIALRMLAG